MTRLDDTTTIDAPADAVWQAIRAPAEHAGWHPFVTSIDGGHDLGDVRRCTAEIDGKPGTTRETCTVLDDGAAIAWRIDEDSLGFSRMVSDWSAGFTIAPAGDATTVTAWSEFRPRAWWVRLMLPMIARKFHATQRAILNGLQQHLAPAIRA
jgi:uncharacterized protein YndB with AHSA1/START domain